MAPKGLGHEPPSKPEDPLATLGPPNMPWDPPEGPTTIAITAFIRSQGKLCSIPVVIMVSSVTERICQSESVDQRPNRLLV